jgi:heme exporter protein C
MDFLTSPVVKEGILLAGFVIAFLGLRAVRSVEGTARWGVFAVAFLLVAQLAAFFMSPPDRDMGDLQKIMYVHVPSAWMALVAFGIVFVGSLLYLWRRDEKYDLIAASTAEAGTVFTALTLAQGMIWGRPTWGIWWTWDPRLTSTAVMLVMYVGYLSLRSFAEDEERRARWSAAVAVLGFLNANIVYMSVRWWRTLHQVQSTPETLSPQYVVGLRLSAFAFLFLLIFFIAYRYHTGKMERQAETRLEEQALAGSVAGV